MIFEKLGDISEVDRHFKLNSWGANSTKLYCTSRLGRSGVRCATDTWRRAVLARRGSGCSRAATPPRPPKAARSGERREATPPRVLLTNLMQIQLSCFVTRPVSYIYGRISHCKCFSLFDMTIDDSPGTRCDIQQSDQFSPDQRYCWMLGNCTDCGGWGPAWRAAGRKYHPALHC